MLPIKSYFNFDLRELFSPSNEIRTDLSKFDRNMLFASFLAGILATYFLSIQNAPMITLLKKILLVVMPLALSLRVLMLRRLNVWLLPFALLVMTYTLVTKRFDIIGEFILLTWCTVLCAYRSIKVSQKHIFFLGLFLCMTIGFHFLVYEVYDRKSIGGLDPNYSSYLIFLLFPLAIYSKSKILHLLLVSLGLLTESRAFFVAALVYFAVIMFKKIKPDFKITLKQYGCLILSAAVIVITYSFYAFHFGSYGQPMASGIKRLLYIFNNPSDFERWKANVVFFELAKSDYNFALSGMNPLNYLSSINHYLPHNIILLELATHGLIVGIVFLVIFFGIVKKVFSNEYLPFFIAILVYWFLLGVEIGAVYNVMMISMLLILNANNEESRA